MLLHEAIPKHAPDVYVWQWIAMITAYAGNEEHSYWNPEARVATKWSEDVLVWYMCMRSGAHSKMSLGLMYHGRPKKRPEQPQECIPTAPGKHRNFGIH